MDLALNLIDQYMGSFSIGSGRQRARMDRQCETTFGTRIDLRNLLKADLWRTPEVELRDAAGR